MNPFDLPGPQFLLFYAVLATAVIALVATATHRAENGLAPRIDFTDPYRIAYLRGDLGEAIRLAVVSLVDRGLVRVVTPTMVQATDTAAEQPVTQPLEAAVLRELTIPSTATGLVDSNRVALSCEKYWIDLVTRGLLPNAEQVERRHNRFWLGALILLAVAGTKLFLAIQRGRYNIGFLIMLAGAAVVALYFISHPRRTARGNAVLADLRRLFAALRGRATQDASRTTVNETLLLAAVFGIAALPPKRFPYVQKLFPKAQSGDSSSSTSTSSDWCSDNSSCGSSCGGGGGGGGCGGCGSS